MGVKSLDLFGSVARNQANPASDIDFLIEFSQPVGLFQLLDVQYFLEDLLERSIDLGTTDSLKEHLREPVLEDAIRVF
ncbi:nucleotidyltransferase [Nodosilinea sp. P-1105]|nr:nucleotidyltransferase family protein [Nodosilinea sp. P-1105]NMF83253.1 nucleotidyltransferase [Nodosilinea sp. P-1105]